MTPKLRTIRTARRTGATVKRKDVAAVMKAIRKSRNAEAGHGADRKSADNSHK
jgi:hypothetical protein